MFEENVPPRELDFALREYSFMIFCSDIAERGPTVLFAAFNTRFFLF